MSADFFMQMIMNLEPRSIPLPPLEVVIDALPMRQVMRQRAPCATASEQVLESIDDLAQSVAAMSAARLLGWQQWL